MEMDAFFFDFLSTPIAKEALALIAFDMSTIIILYSSFLAVRAESFHSLFQQLLKFH